MREFWEDLGAFAQGMVIVFIIGLVIGACVLGWVRILGPAFNTADYNNFNSSPQHLQAVSQKFSDDCLQLSETTDPVTKKAIEQDIYSMSSTVDLNTIVMPSGVRSCVNSAIAAVTSGK